MYYKRKYTDEKATEQAKLFIDELHKLEKKYDLSVNSDRGDIYLTYLAETEDFCDESSGKIFTQKKYGHVNLYWVGDGTSLQVKDETKANLKKQALEKLTQEEREALGL
jgi:hypothetical protein